MTDATRPTITQPPSCLLRPREEGAVLQFETDRGRVELLLPHALFRESLPSIRFLRLLLAGRMVGGRKRPMH